MRLDTLWIVCDPTPASEFADICWEQPVRTLHYQIVGIAMMPPRNEWQLRDYTIWTTEAEALADANARLAARDAIAAGKAEAPPDGAEDRCLDAVCEGRR